jgi:hypothetical protein
LLRIQDQSWFAHPNEVHAKYLREQDSGPGVESRSVIIRDFAIKSSFFMLLGAARLKKRIFALTVGLWTCLICISCGGSGGKKTTGASGLPNRVLASQGVSSSVAAPGLVIINAFYDTLPRLANIGAGNSPGLMAISPGRNVVATFDASSNAVYGVNTATEADIGHVSILGPTQNMIVPTGNPIGYAAVPSASPNGYSFQGAVEVMNFSTGQLTTIAVSSAQNVVANSTASQLLVFSNDSNSMTVISPAAAAPPVDTSCLTNPPNAVCTIVPGFDRPVFAVVNGNTAYILNCGAECGGVQASVMIFDIPSLTVTQTIPVDAATWALLNGSTLYVTGTSPTNNACTGETTAAKTCGRLDIIDLTTAKVTGSVVITDGYHDRMDFTNNGELFIGSYDCTNIGNAYTPSGGEVRGCLTIYNTTNNVVTIPPDNGDVTGLQGFTTRYVEYVAENGNLRVYNTITNSLDFTYFLPQGTININGYIADVKAIDFF